MGFAGGVFGSSIGQSYLANVTNPAVLTVACLAIIIAFMFVMPLMTNPILLALLPVVKASTPLQISLFKVSFCIVSAAAAIFLQDYLAALSSLTGSSLTMLTLVFIPAAIYIRLVPDISAMEKIALAIVSLSSLVFVILGTYVAAVDIFA